MWLIVNEMNSQFRLTGSTTGSCCEMATPRRAPSLTLISHPFLRIREPSGADINFVHNESSS